MPSLRSRVDLDAHTVTCIKCGLVQRSLDLCRTSLALVVAYEDRFSVEHVCTERKPVPSYRFGDAWKEAWEAYERNHVS
jgi:hypothetical protein